MGGSAARDAEPGGRRRGHFRAGRVAVVVQNSALFLEATGEAYYGLRGLRIERTSKLTYVGRLRGYRDITEGTNLDVGGSYAFGPSAHVPEPARAATGLWGSMRRSGIAAAPRHLQAFPGEDRAGLEPAARDGLDGERVRIYASADYQFARRWYAGARTDRAAWTRRWSIPAARSSSPTGPASSTRSAAIPPDQLRRRRQGQRIPVPVEFLDRRARRARLLKVTMMKPSSRYSSLLALAGAVVAALPKVVTTTEDLAALVREVGGDKVTVESMAKGYQDPHFVEPEAELHHQAARRRSADRRSAASSKSAGCRRCSRRAATRRFRSGARATSTRRRACASSRSRPGRSRARWATCIRRAIRTTGSIPTTAGSSRSQSRPRCRRSRRPTSATSISATRTSIGGWPRRAEALGRRRWRRTRAPKVVTYHRSWPNFTERFGLDVIGYVEPKPGIPPSPSHTIDLIAEMKRQQVKVILRRAVLRPEDAGVDRARSGRQGAGDGAVSRRRQGSRRLHRAVRLQRQPADQRRSKQLPASSRWIRPAILEFLAAPFVASLILTGIHAYLGVHVVERGVIFVDLSLAQIAALGATMAMLLPFSGGDPHGPGVYWFSLGFTFIGAAVFSLDPSRAEERASRRKR